MPSKTETGHARNVAHFSDLINYCIGYDTIYNPSNAAIKITALQTLLTSAKASITAINTNLPTFNNAVSSREAAFEPLSKLITRVINALKASGTTPQIVDSAKTFARKLQGRRASKKTTMLKAHGEPIPGAEITLEQEPFISSSQMSYDNRLDNFDKLIRHLNSIPQYVPNETDLSIEGLSAIYADLKSKNSDVISALVIISNARIARNEILYNKKTGMVSIAKNVKNYIKSIFGATSPQYKQISSITFTSAR